MKLYFKKIRFKNFMSFGNEWTEIDFVAAPTTLVIGKNGSGKSSAILDSISFVLFNKPFRNIRKPQLTNSINAKGCLVELDFIVNGFEFKVIRGQKPNIFEIYKDGDLITQNADNRDYQDAFEKYILKVNHKTFCQIVMLGSAIFTPFMALPTPQRREVIEDLLDLQVFSAMNALLKSKIDDCDRRLYELENNKRINATKITMMTKHLEEMQSSRDDMIASKKELIAKMEQQTANLNEEKAVINGNIARLVEKVAIQPKITERYSTIKELQTTLQHKAQMINKEISFLEANENCPTCHQVIEPEFKVATIESRHKDNAEVEEALAKLKEQFEKVDSQMDYIQDLQRQITSMNTDLKTRDTEIKMLTKNIKGLNKEIDDLQQKTMDVDANELTKIKEERDALDKAYGEVSDDRTVMGYASGLLKDSGIKSRIIKNYIPVINQLIAKYLAALDFFVDFQLDENFNETIRSRFRDDFSYNSFSEGEKMRLNIAILFTWRAIAKLRGSIDTNLIICDEIFDGSMDSDGLEDMLKLINNLTSNENVFIISHKEDQLGDKFTRVIKFHKVSNFSKMIER